MHPLEQHGMKAGCKEKYLTLKAGLKNLEVCISMMLSLS